MWYSILYTRLHTINKHKSTHFHTHSFTVQLASCFAWDGFSVIHDNNLRRTCDTLSFGTATVPIYSISQSNKYDWSLLCIWHQMLPNHGSHKCRKLVWQVMFSWYVTDILLLLITKKSKIFYTKYFTISATKSDIVHMEIISRCCWWKEVILYIWKLFPGAVDEKKSSWRLVIWHMEIISICTISLFVALFLSKLVCTSIED